MIRFVAEVGGVEVLNRAFNRVDRGIDDFRNFAPGIAREFYAIEEQQFRSEGAAGASGKWAPLSLSYARFKARAFPGAPILQRERSLYESLTSPDAPDSVFRVSQSEIVIGTKSPYARAHQSGGGRLPARPPISFTERDRRRLQKAIQAQLVKLTRDAGFEVKEEKAA